MYVNGRHGQYLTACPDLAESAVTIAALQHTFIEVFARIPGVSLWVKLVTTNLIEGLMDGVESIRQLLAMIPDDGDLH